VTVGGLLASGALASRKSRSIAHHHSSKVHFSVFKHHSKRARTANAVAAGAVLAAVIKTGGVENEVYVSHEGTEICLSANQSGESAEGCGDTSTAEEQGLSSLWKGQNVPLTMMILVPDGVETVTFIDKDGSEHTVPVTNDVVVRTDPSLASAKYVMPDQAPHTVKVPKFFGAPTAPTSSAAPPQTQ
jgi:hypothetical protein